LGYAPHEIGDRLTEWTDRLHPEDLTEAMAAVQGHLDGKTDHYESIPRMRAKAGRYRACPDRGKVVSRDADGTPLRVIGTHQDITDQRNAEAAARDLQRQMTALLRFSPTLVTVIDRDGRYLQASAAVATTIGRPVGEIVGRLL